MLNAAMHNAQCTHQTPTQRDTAVRPCDIVHREFCIVHCHVCFLTAASFHDPAGARIGRHHAGRRRRLRRVLGARRQPAFDREAHRLLDRDVHDAGVLVHVAVAVQPSLPRSRGSRRSRCAETAAGAAPAAASRLRRRQRILLLARVLRLLDEQSATSPRCRRARRARSRQPEAELGDDPDVGVGVLVRRALRRHQVLVVAAMRCARVS